MKKFIFVAAFVFSLVSCEEEVRDNSPAFEATIGYTKWKADSWSAVVENETLTIIGRDLTNQIKITIPNYQLGQNYDLGVNNSEFVEYTVVNDDESVTVYKTGTDMGGGYVKFESAEFSEPNTITGRFMAEVKTATGKSETLHEGIFYRIPLTQPQVEVVE